MMRVRSASQRPEVGWLGMLLRVYPRHQSLTDGVGFTGACQDEIYGTCAHRSGGLVAVLGNRRIDSAEMWAVSIMGTCVNNNARPYAV